MYADNGGCYLRVTFTLTTWKHLRGTLAICLYLMSFDPFPPSKPIKEPKHRVYVPMHHALSRPRTDVQVRLVRLPPGRGTNELG